uniref:Uncharacterized protein n=1 Tax=Musa acuminata subsp. malaccensis TaxID=214687 RepID=A0A804K6Z6_MUSAM
MAEPGAGTKEAPVELEASRPQKKSKMGPQKGDMPPPRAREVVVEPGRRDRRRGPSRGEAGPSNEVAGKAPREPSIRDLCHLPAGAQDEPYQARVMGGLPEGQPFDPLLAWWAGLTRGTRVWVDGEAAASFARGRLHPDMAPDLYTVPSDVLLGKSAKSLLWSHHYTTVLMDRVRDASRALGVLSDRNAELRRQLEEVRAGAAPEAVAAAEQRASDLEAEVSRLSSTSRAAEQCALKLEAESVRLTSEAKAAKD